jgi:hypothetical protein
MDHRMRLWIIALLLTTTSAFAQLCPLMRYELNLPHALQHHMRLSLVNHGYQLASLSDGEYALASSTPSYREEVGLLNCRYYLGDLGITLFKKVNQQWSPIYSVSSIGRSRAGVICGSNVIREIKSMIDEAVGLLPPCEQIESRFRP